MHREQYFMTLALEEAKKAYANNEVPVGAVLVLDEEVIGRGHNRTDASRNPLLHAEMLAIAEGVEKTGDLRLPEAELFVTLEPCAMCAGAVVLSRLKRVYIGAMDPKRGCCGSVMNLLQEDRFNHRAEVVTGVLQQECSEILSAFFRELRESKKAAEEK